MATTVAPAPTPPVVRTPIGLASQAIQAPYLDWANGQVLSIGASAVSSVAYAGPAQGGQTDTVYEVTATVNAWYSVGNTATKDTAGSQYLVAGATRYVYVPGGATLSAIADSSTGYLSMVPALLI